jgi:hypothetical protein
VLTLGTYLTTTDNIVRARGKIPFLVIVVKILSISKLISENITFSELVGLYKVINVDIAINLYEETRIINLEFVMELGSS